MRLIQSEDLRACGVKNVSKTNALVYFLTHPEFKAVVTYRWILSCYAQSRMKKTIAKFLWVRMTKKTGCYLSPKAKVGKGFRLPHATGIVVGDGAVIGDHVTFYQHVTLGRKGGEEAYPSIGNNVIIYAGACIIGDITIGDGAVVGANSVVTKDVAAYTTVAGVPAKVIKSKT